jgi:hypothetical protein
VVRASSPSRQIGSPNRAGGQLFISLPDSGHESKDREEKSNELLRRSDC